MATIREGGLCNCAPELGSLYTVVLRDGRTFTKCHIQGFGGTLKEGKIPKFLPVDKVTIFLVNRASSYFTIPLAGALIESVTHTPEL